jgi:putative aldouronate transport system permease protein
MLLVVVVTVYPFLYVLSMSISSPINVLQKKVWLYPVGISFESYGVVLKDPEIWLAYFNTIWYTVVGTSLNVPMTLTAAYVLSRRTFFARKTISLFIIFTMFFSGGMIPLFLLIRNIGLYDTRWALILPWAVSTYYILVAISFFKTIPESIQESARIDGANDIVIFLRIMVPLSAPIIAVLALFYAVSQWNSYFPALIYLSDNRLKPLQVYLYRILVQSDNRLMNEIHDTYERTKISSQLKYVVIMVAILPIITTYPFLQKYFVKGALIGAVKE